MNMSGKEFNKYLNSLILAAKTEGSTSIQAYEKIFEAIKPFIYKHGRQVLSQYNLNGSSGNGIDNKYEWEEHFQNLYIEMYECINRFELNKETKFTYYVTVCIRNYFHNYAQKQLKILTKEQSIDKSISSSEKNMEDMDSILLDTFASNEEGPEERCVNAERSRKIAAALMKLNDEQKRFIYYYYSEKMHLTKIANLFDQKYHTIRYLRNRTLQELRNRLQR
jgi:RNA polymerase sigma factor (sigma-70 family)